jgi:hypothetical protein
MGGGERKVVMVVSADVSVPPFEFWWMGMWMWIGAFSSWSC